ncbi:MAG: NAD(P)-dependent oxidoreductase [Polyangiales bacterium]
MANLAFLGTGLIGAGMVEAALRRGESVTVWNRTAAKTAPLAALGAKVAPSPADAVRGVARVHVVLKDDAAVDDVLGRCRDALGAETVVVDHSTTSPAGVVARAARIPGYLHAPVFMSPQGSRDAKGMILVSGPRARFERVEAGLGAMTGEVWYLGERVDLAAAQKLFGNAMITLLVGALADVYALARSLGVPAPDAHALFQRFKVGAVIDARGAKMAHGDYAPAFELTMARKDVGLMLAAAGAEPLGLLPALAARMDALIAAGHGGLDLAALSIDAVPPKQG